MCQAGFEELLDEQIHTFTTEFPKGIGQRIEQCEFISDEFENQVNYCVFQAEQRRGHFFILSRSLWIS